MTRFSFSSLRDRLLLLVLFAVLPVLVLILYTAAEQRQLAAAQAQKEALRLVRQASGEQEQLIAGARQLLAVMAQLPEVRGGNTAACSAFFTHLLEQYPIYTNLGLVKPDGELLCSAIPAGNPVNLADRAFFQRALQTRDFAIGDYQVGPISVKAALPFSYPVLNEAGQVQAVLFAALDLTWLDQLAVRAELPPGAALTVIDRNGTVLSRYPDAEKWAGKPMPEAPVIRTVLNRQGEGTAESTGIDGMPKLYAFRPLYSTAGIGDIYIYTGIPTKIAFAGANRLLARNLAGIGLVTALVLAIAWAGGSRFFLRRVNALLGATKQLAAGDLSARTGLPYGEEELGQLARAFDEMAEAMEHSAAKLEAAKKELENEIIEHKRVREVLRESEDRYRTIFETTGTATAIIEEDTTISLVNTEFVKLSGYSKEELEGKKSWTEFVVKDDLERMKEYHRVRRIDADAAPRNYEFRFIDRQDNVRDIFIEIAVIPGTKKSVVSLLDITGRKQAEERIQQLYSENQRQLKSLSALYASSQKLGQSLDLQELAGDIARTCVEVFGVSLAWLGRAEVDGRVRLLTHFPPESEYPSRIAVRWDDSPLGQGPIGRAIRSGSPVIFTDLAGDPRFEPWYAVALTEGFCTSAAFPLISRDRPFGTLNLFSDQPDFFTPGRVEFFQAYANQAAAALENARLFEEAERRLRYVQALRDIDMAVTASLDLHVTLNIVLDQVINQLGVHAAGILLLNRHTQVLEYAAGRGFRFKDIERSSLRLGEDYAGRTALERRIVNINNLHENSDEFTRAPLPAGEDFIAYYGVPLIAEGQVKGLLEIFHRTPLDPDPEWLEFLETLAGQAVIVIENASLLNDLQRSNIELTLAYDATIEGLSYALDLRDKETEGHSRRVTEMTVRLARAMGMTEAELVHLRRGALLHDIGKMGIPDHILLKPGPLTDEEWEIMRRHPVYAYEMLSRIGHLRPALDIPYCHHEKWDGTGYPRGLKGEQIPLAARIFAVVDVWDALRSERPYRPAWPEEKVREHIRKQAGKHFDPKTLEVFLEMKW